MPITEEIEGTGPGPDDPVQTELETETPAETPDADVEGAEEDGEAAEGSDEEPEGAGAGAADGKLDFVIEGEGDEPPADKKSSDKAFGHLRKGLAAAQREAAELRQQLADARKQVPDRAGVTDPGPEPTEESCGYDANRLKVEYLEWVKKSAAFDEAKKKEAADAERDRQEWIPIQTTARGSRDAIAKQTEDFESAEVAFCSVMSPLRQGIIMDLFPERYGELVYVLGRNPDRLKALVEQKNEARFIRELIKLEAKVKPKDKAQKTPTPDKPVQRGSGGGSAPTKPGVDPHLERLRKEAERTNDFTKIREYKDSLRNKERAA